jgi:hypothetical protein
MGCLAIIFSAAFSVAVIVYMSGLIGLVVGFMALMGGYMSGLVAFIVGFLMLS